MKKTIQAKSHLFGNNIDTDQICPGQYLELTDHADIGKHCLEGADKTFPTRFIVGEIIIAGTNFGCGSSREHAAIALKNLGASAIIAESFARIFYRNAINMGIPLITCKGICNIAHDGDEIFLDMENNKIINKTTKKELSCDPISDYAMKILQAGGIKPLLLTQE